MRRYVAVFIGRWMLGAALGLAAMGALAAQGYPDRPVHLIVPFPPGGAVDLAARLIQQPLAARLGQSVIVENRPGAGGGIGSRAVAQAEPDGYTLLVTVVGTISIAPSLYRNIGYTANNFAPVARIFSTPLFVMVRQDSKYRTLQSLIAAGKGKAGGKAAPVFGSAGNGALSHLGGIMLNAAADTGFVHVPYKGGGAMTLALMAGQTDFSLLASSDAMPQVKAGKLRALAALTAARTEPFPGVPTALEQGVQGLAFDVWYGLLAPAGTPPAVVDRLNQSLQGILADPSMLARIRDIGAVPPGGGNTPAAFDKVIAGEIPMYAKAIRLSGAKVD